MYKVGCFKKFISKDKNNSMSSADYDFENIYTNPYTKYEKKKIEPVVITQKSQTECFEIIVLLAIILLFVMCIYCTKNIIELKAQIKMLRFLK